VNRVLELLLAGAGGVLLLWVAAVVALWAGARHEARPLLREALRLLPDVVRLVRRLASDPSLPRRLRVRLWLLAGYLVLPVDLVPDFVPVLGYADDVLLVAWVLRSVVSSAGEGVVASHWPGTPAGLTALRRLLSGG